MTADLVWAKEVSKFASREVYGIIRELPDQDESLKLLNKDMIFEVLSNSVCLSELTTDEVAMLTGIITLHS